MKKQNEKKEIRALGRMMAQEMTHEELAKLTGARPPCITGPGGSSCFVGGFDVADATP